MCARILQTPAAYVPIDPEAPGLLSARVMKQSGLKYCAVKTDFLQVGMDRQELNLRKIQVVAYLEFMMFVVINDAINDITKVCKSI